MTFNGRSNGQSNAALTREEAICLVDACRDGDISESDVSRLSRLLESHDERAMWVLDELELSGLIAQALDSTDTNSFLRGFIERLSAEKPTDDFADVAEQRLAAGGDSDLQQQAVSSSADAIGMMFGRKSGTAVRIEPSRPAGKARFLLLGAAVLIVAAAAAMFLTRPPPSHGRIVSASPGVMVGRASGETSATAGMQLRAGDTVQVPHDGRAVMSYDDGTRVKLLPQTRLRLLTDDSGDTVLLESGQVAIETPGAIGDYPVTIASMHVQIGNAGASEYAVTVTPTSTRLVVGAGEVEFRRRDTGDTGIVRTGEESVITAGKQP